MDQKNRKYPKGHFVSLGLVLGIPIGIPIGLILGNIALGPPIGVSIGVILGLALEKKYEKEGKIRPLTKNEEIIKKRNQKMVLIVFLVALLVGAILGMFFNWF